MEFEVFQSVIMELIRFQLSKEFPFPRLVLRRPVLSSLLRAIYFMHRSIGPQVHHAKADWRDVFDFDAVIDTIDEEFEITLAIDHDGNGLVGFQFVKMTTDIVFNLLTVLEEGA